MNCERAKENMTLHLYGELADDVRYELEQHLGRCPECEREYQHTRQFHSEMNSLPQLEPSASLVAAARIRLHEALDTAEQTSGWRRWVFDPVEWLRQMRFSPALASAILIVGFTGGVLATFQIANSRQPNGIPAPTSNALASVAAISGISQDPNSNNVQIKYDTVQPASANGSLDDPKIEQLLLYAARNQQNPGVRVESVDLLSRKCEKQQIRELMMYSLRYDANPGVRLKALDALQGYVKTDLRVRDAVLEALLYDANSGVRTEAIHLLQPVKADSSVRTALQQLAAKDKNPYIRRESERLLASVANIE